MNLKDNENLFVLGSFLALTSIISGVLLAVFSDVVAQPIAEAKLRNTNQSLEMILPAFDNQPSENVTEIDGVKFLGATKDGKLVAVAAEASAKGYSGPVEALIGIEPDGKIIAVLITKQTETPGLGTNVCERKTQKTVGNMFDKQEGLPPNKILDQFKGQTSDGNWKVKKDGGTIEYITGATITSRAVTAVVNRADSTFVKNKAKIIEALSKGGK